MGAIKVAFGILGWCSSERRGNRYGLVTLGAEPYEGDARAEVHFARAALQERRGQRMRLTAKIVESRVSSHVGDAGLGVRPPDIAPDDGQVIVASMLLCWNDRPRT